MDDRINITLTRDADAAAEALTERFHIPRKVQVVRLGLAYALRHKLPLDRGDSWGPAGKQGNFHVSTVDGADRTFSQLLPLFYDDTEAVTRPYRSIETLMTKGVLLLKQHADQGVVTALGDLAQESSV